MSYATPKGIPAPSGDDPFAQGDLFMRALADAVDALLPTIDNTTVSAAGFAPGLADFDIAFDTPFDVAPRAVIAQISGFVAGSSRIQIFCVRSITTDGFQLVLANLHDSADAAFDNLPIKFLAFG